MMPFTLNIRGGMVSYDRPVVMGIINATPDSFYAGSRTLIADEISRRAEAMCADGADIIDVGACSTRPGAEVVAEAEELERLAMALPAVRRAVGGDVLVSVDTFMASVARVAVKELGADIVNDVSGGTLDADMFATVASLACPYILMHTRGTPATMQTMTDYNDVCADVIKELSFKLAKLRELGVSDVIIDPGFGFAKTSEQNYELLAGLSLFDVLGCPVLVGVSRKSMLTATLGISAENAATPTAILGALALERGASVLRVHDVLAARQSIELLKALKYDFICSPSV